MNEVQENWNSLKLLELNVHSIICDCDFAKQKTPQESFYELLGEFLGSFNCPLNCLTLSANSRIAPSGISNILRGLDSNLQLRELIILEVELNNFIRALNDWQKEINLQLQQNCKPIQSGRYSFRWSLQNSHSPYSNWGTNKYQVTIRMQ